MADSRNPQTPVDAGLSRRHALAAAGALAAVAGDAAALASPATRPGSGVEFRARFAQTGNSGELFVAWGYVTRAPGAIDEALFADATPNETTALMTAYASGRLTRRTIDQSVHSLDIEGELTIYQRASAGATFAAPESFAVGTPVSRYDLTLQDILSVLLPGQGIPTLTGSMRQTLAEPLAGLPASARLGHIGASARLFATGVGRLVDPVTLNAVLEMAGNWVLA